MRAAGLAFRYRLFGMSVESAIRLPELDGLPPPKGSEPPEIRIALGQPAGPDAYYLLDIPDIAQYWVGGGRWIHVEARSGASDREVRLFLLGSALGIALHQRGILPLHANAIAVDGRAVAFMGRSGAGKSTLAAWFHDQGYRVLADDICVVKIEQGRPMAYPGLPRLRLWEDALLASGRDPGDHQRSFHTPADERRKFDVPINSDAVAANALPLAALFVLEEGPKLRIESVTGAGTVEAISANTYRGGMIGRVGDFASHLDVVVSIARSVPTFRLARPIDRSRFDADCRSILRRCQSLCGPSSPPKAENSARETG